MVATRPPCPYIQETGALKRPDEGYSLVRNPPKHIPFPSKDQVLAFINEHPGKVGTREIARAFNLKNDRRVELKHLLRELADEGRVEARRKKLHKAGGLPDVTLADITGRDNDGELLATPTEWDEDEHGPVPKIRIATPRKARPHEAAGVGDRALLRVQENRQEESSDGVRYSGRVSAVLPTAVRLLIVKADGSVLVHSDAGGYKPLNWMTPPTRITESPGLVLVEKRTGAKLERLEIHIDDAAIADDDPPGHDPVGQDQPAGQAMGRAHRSRGRRRRSARRGRSDRPGTGTRSPRSADRGRRG